jgi:hypothetical protein
MTRHVSHPFTTPYAHCPMVTSSPTCIPHQIPHDLSPRLHKMHLHTPLIARRHHLVSHTPQGGVKPPNALWRGWSTVVNGLAMTCMFLVWHCWEGPETTTGAYGNWCKPVHTVHVVNNFNFNFITESVMLPKAIILGDNLPAAFSPPTLTPTKRVCRESRSNMNS